VTLRTLLFVVIAVDPFGAAVVVARLRDRVTAAVAAVAVSAALLLLACAAGPWLLGRLDISAEAAEIAAGVVLLVPALALCARGDQMFLAGDRSGGWRGGIVPVALPLLAGPAPLSVVVALGARRGRGDVAAAVSIAVVLSAIALFVATRRASNAVAVPAEPSTIERVAGRFVGAAMVLVAFALVVDGVLGV
jgi:multiple antibiotic resistance protein